jgi:hypothetical protein
VAADGAAAAQVLARVFGGVLPRVTFVGLPRREDGSAGAPEGLRIEGTYGNAAVTARIAQRSPGRFLLTLDQTGPAVPGRALIRGASLSPRAQHAFFVLGEDRRHCAFLQFIAPDARGRSTYVWNGKALWRRLQDPAESDEGVADQLSKERRESSTCAPAVCNGKFAARRSKMSR